MPPRKRKTTSRRVVDDLVIPVADAPVVDATVDAPVVDATADAPVDDATADAPVDDLPTDAPADDVPVPRKRKPAVRRVRAEPSPPAGAPSIDDASARMFSQMQDMISQQNEMIARLSSALDDKQSQAAVPPPPPPSPPSEPESEPEPVSLEWPKPPAPQDPVSSPDAESVSSTRREPLSLKFSQVYATDTGVAMPPNIMDTDAVCGVMGKKHHGNTRVGLATRGLKLNPTLQQPSIGGLV